MNELEHAQDLAEAGELDDAYRLADKALKEDPNNLRWLMVMTYLMLQSEKPVLAYHLAKRCTDIAPREAGAWMNRGMSCRDLWRDEEGLRYFRRGMKYSNNDAQKSQLAINISSILIDTGQFVEGEKYCHQALELNPDSVKARANLGFCQLAQRNWGEGWNNYRSVIGHEWRPRHKYADEPLWDGRSKGTIVVYGEQGLGDQISFASMLPDMKEWCDKNDSRLIVDINPRLGNLLRRTFPDIRIYGNQMNKNLTWLPEDQSIDYSIPIGQLGEYFRTSDEDFPGSAFLQPDADRVLQWKALFQSKEKPVIGLAWSGGIPKTGSKFRRVDLDRLLPLLKSVDAHWVSLQYKPSGKEIERFKRDHPEIDIHQYSHCTLSQDYDDTVAMVAALDHVVCMHTTIVHVAGGLGVPCWTFVPQNSQWRYGTQGEDFPWASSVRILRQRTRGYWEDIIEETGNELKSLYAGVRGTAKKAPRKRKLRSNGAKVRPTRKQARRRTEDRPSA